MSERISDSKINKFDGILYAVYADKKLEKALPSLELTSREFYNGEKIFFEFEEFGFFKRVALFNLDYISEIAASEKFRFFMIIRETSYDKELTEIPVFYDDPYPFYTRSVTKTITHGMIAVLYTTTDTSEVWRAQIELESGDFGNSNQTGISIGKTLIKQLKKDGILLN